MSDYCLLRRAEKEFSWPFSMFLVSHTVILIDEDFFYVTNDRAIYVFSEYIWQVSFT